jgi:hypothetical protein
LPSVPSVIYLRILTNSSFSISYDVLNINTVSPPINFLSVFYGKVT